MKIRNGFVSNSSSSSFLVARGSVVDLVKLRQVCGTELDLRASISFLLLDTIEDPVVWEPDEFTADGDKAWYNQCIKDGLRAYKSVLDRDDAYRAGLYDFQLNTPDVRIKMEEGR